MRPTDWVSRVYLSRPKGQDILTVLVCLLHLLAFDNNSGPTAAEHPVLTSGLDITLPPSASTTAQTAQPHSEVRKEKAQVRSGHAMPTPMSLAHAATTSFVYAHWRIRMTLVVMMGCMVPPLDHVSSRGRGIATITMGGRGPGCPRFCARGCVTASQQLNRCCDPGPLAG